jgi:hypothetical protein
MPTEGALGTEMIAPDGEARRGTRWKPSRRRGEGLAAARVRSHSGGGGTGDLCSGGGGGALEIRL